MRFFEHLNLLKSLNAYCDLTHCEPYKSVLILYEYKFMQNSCKPCLTPICWGKNGEACLGVSKTIEICLPIQLRRGVRAGSKIGMTIKKRTPLVKMSVQKLL